MARPARVMSLGPVHLAKVARKVERGPQDPRCRLLSERDFEDQAARLVAELQGWPFWIFVYGSLIWKPDFEFVDARRNLVHGWRRHFCIHITNWRATPDTPGLMMGLARGGSCPGVAYRMPDDDTFGRMLRLLRRECSCHEDMPWLRWVTVRGAGDPIRALAFYCAPPGNPDAVLLPLEEQVRRLARAVIFLGQWRRVPLQYSHPSRGGGYPRPLSLGPAGSRRCRNRKTLSERRMNSHRATMDLSMRKCTPVGKLPLGHIRQFFGR